MAECLVIGGNGFIGSHLVDHLVDLGHSVRVFDRFSGATVRFSSANVKRIIGDFLNTGHLAPAIDGVDLVFHFLSTTTPASAEQDPLIDVRTNITSTVELLRYCAATGVRRVYFASTGGAIYGELSTSSADEDACPQPISPYAIGKLAIEGYLRYFRVAHGLDSTALRISNPYGPRQNPSHRQGVIPIFLRHVARGEPITIYGDGSMVRDYIYVQDVATSIGRMLESEPMHDTYNIGTGSGHSLLSLIDVIEVVTGLRPTIEFVPKPPTFVEHVVLDTTRYQREFGRLEKPTALEAGIRETWTELTRA